MVLGVSEILKRIETAGKGKSDAEIIQLLRNYDCTPLRTVLNYALNPAIKWLLPSGEISYKPNEEVLGSEMMLRKDARTLYLFCSGGPEENPNITPARREHKFKELLESVHPQDALLLLDMKDRKFPYPSIRIDLVQQAFPGIF